MKRLVLPLLVVFLLGGCRASSETAPSSDSSSDRKVAREKYPNPNPGDTRECARNFTYDGSFARGRAFKTTAFVKGVSQAQAVKRAISFLSSEGMQIVSADASLGMVSASQAVSYGNGKTAPLNVGVAQEKGGVKVNLTFSISGGLTSPVGTVQNFFCSAVQAMEGK